MKPVRCAVYTRKSSEEGLEQSFNSLHAQREACEAYVLSQKHEGWRLVPTAYDDGGFSGGSMERPGLKALLADVEAGLIDTVVVYKVDRLTRSLADFAKMVERFDAKSTSFVSVTQAFNTTTSMGRLTLNVLLSFAQFEREVTGERIRDKIAASNAKGMWMGGMVPLGYDVVERQLVVNEPEAEQVRVLFDLYRDLKAVDAVVAEAAAQGIRSKQRVDRAGKPQGGAALGRGSLYAMLGNPIYVGEIGHGDKRYPGQHQAIVERATYDAVQALLAANRRKAKGKAGASASILSGLVVDGDGERMTATHTLKGTTRYRYYANAARRVPAGDLDTIVLDALAQRLGSPEQLATVLPDLAALTPEVINKAASTAKRLRTRDAGARRDLVLDLVEQVRLGSEAATIIIHLEPLGLEGTASISVATELGRAKARLALVVPGSTAPNPDRALISMVAQARAWFEELSSGRQATLAGVAAAHCVTEPYVRQFIGAAFLAPDIVTRIVEGRQPAALTVARLRDLLPLPTCWHAQRSLLLESAGS